MTLDNGQELRIDLGTVKARQKATWTSGDYAIIGTTLQIVGETLCEALGVRSGQKVLDAACGNGNASLAAARRFARVTGADYVPSLLDKAKLRARAEGLSIDFVEADVEALPFADESFDVVLSTFGTMFAPNQPVVASELLRVCRRGGRIGLANWTPTGFVGEMLRLVGRFAPPPRGLPSPTLWGDRARVAELFGDKVSSLSFERRHFAFRYESAKHFVDVFRAFYGPVHRTFAVLDDPAREALQSDLEALLRQHDRSRGASLVVPAEYLEVVAVRR